MPQRPAPREEPVTVLIADGDPAVLNLLRLPLERRGFGVATSTCPADAAGVLAEQPADIAVIQVGGPFGFDAIYAIRKLNSPVDIWLLALLPPGEDSQVAVAIEEGADDGMMKPISPRELMARVEAKARRLPRAATVLQFDGLCIDMLRREVTIGESPVDLPPREFDLLVYLAMRPDEVVSRERILEDLWGSTLSWQSDDTLTEHIHRLRRRIEGIPAHPRWVHTARGVGYRFSPGSRA
jgi:two-component system, OmpR family, phosphate regulon response regulator PhoB